MRSKANQIIRNMARANHIPLWRIALQVGVSEQTIIRWLRVPLTAEKESTIMTAIHTIAEEEEAIEG